MRCCPASVRPRKRDVRIAWARWQLLGARLAAPRWMRGHAHTKNGPCTCFRTVPRACPAPGDSDPVDLRHPKQFHLWLLPSGPDQVHGASPRRTRSSTPSDKGSPRDRSPRAGIQPRCSGLRVQGTASSPSSTAIGYRSREARAGSRTPAADVMLLLGWRSKRNEQVARFDALAGFERQRFDDSGDGRP